MKIEAPRPGGKVRGSKSGRPLMALLDVLGRRGTLRILWELREGQCLTFRDLQRAAELPPATLNTRLRELRELSLVHTEEGYALTALGAQLVSAMAPLNGFSQRWARALER